MSDRSEKLDLLFAALAAAQGEITNAEKDRLNPHFKSQYATLGSVWDACRKPLSKAGLCVTQLPSDDGLMLTTILGHSSGQWISSDLPVLAKEKSAQGMGSALTYARRYALSAIVGVAPDEDDDGNSASGRGGDDEEDGREAPRRESQRPALPPELPEGSTELGTRLLGEMEHAASLATLAKVREEALKWKWSQAIRVQFAEMVAKRKEALRTATLPMPGASGETLAKSVAPPDASSATPPAQVVSFPAGRQPGDDEDEEAGRPDAPAADANSTNGLLLSVVATEIKALLAEIAKSATLADLTALGKRIKALPESDQEVVLVAYRSRRTELGGVAPKGGA